MKLSQDRLRTYRKLGLWNLISVAFYRWQLRSGHFVKTMPVVDWVAEGTGSLLPGANDFPVADAPYSVRFFNDRLFDQASPPEWFANPYTQSLLVENQTHWSTMPDFDLDIGDVKTLWELSRFDWLIKACWQIRDKGVAPMPLNEWLDNWCKLNPVNQGVNWKCAQEASIRAMNLVLAHFILNPQSQDANPRFYGFLAAHVKRILPTISYARAQDNNHGTSEAAALFVLGTVLARSADNQFKALADSAVKQGRRLLDERTAKLIGEDGVFSQYSVNYHRMMLDTLSFAELVRRHFGAPAFSQSFMAKAQQATQWMLSVTDPISGDAPNMGTNDGSLLFNCRDMDFRDFRPSCALAASLFLNRSVFPIYSHGLSEVFPSHLPPLAGGGSQSHSTSGSQHSTASIELPGLAQGFKRIGNASTFAILKVPHDRFRPSQADALHLDVWHNGINLIRDAGTYSYNPPDTFSEDLGDTRYHSTVEIDGRNQMIKLSRFLYTGWLSPRPSTIESSGSDSRFPDVQGMYIDYEGASHSRHVSFDGDVFSITDEIQGCRQNATLRFRLPPAEWRHNGRTIESEGIELSVNGSAIVDTSLKQSVESRYYLQLSEIPVFEIALSGDSVITTTLRLTPHR